MPISGIDEGKIPVLKVGSEYFSDHEEIIMHITFCRNPFNLAKYRTWISMPIFQYRKAIVLVALSKYLYTISFTYLVFTIHCVFSSPTKFISTKN
jgi:hypothetical protein